MMRLVAMSVVCLGGVGLATAQSYEPPPLDSVPVPEESGVYLHYPEHDHMSLVMPWPLSEPRDSSFSQIEQRDADGGAVVILNARGESDTGLERMLNSLAVAQYGIVRLDAPQQVWLGGDRMTTVHHRDQSAPHDLRPYLRPELAPDEDTWVFDIRAARVNLRLSAEWYDEEEDIGRTQIVTISSDALDWEREMDARAERASGETE